jgi:hypothetical protein
MPSTSFLKGRALILAATGGESYYHWMMDVIPRIELAKKSGFKLESFDHFVVNGMTKPFQQETLQALGIPLEKCRVFGKRKTAYLCEEAVLPSMPGPMGLPPPEIVEFLRSSFSAGPDKGAELLFVGRNAIMTKAQDQSVIPYRTMNMKNKKKFILVVKTAFNQRRKTLRNALKSILPPEMLLDPIMDKRAEQLSVTEFVNIYHTLINK